MLQLKTLSPHSKRSLRPPQSPHSVRILLQPLFLVDGSCPYTSNSDGKILLENARVPLEVVLVSVSWGVIVEFADEVM